MKFQYVLPNGSSHSGLNHGSTSATASKNHRGDVLQTETGVLESIVDGLNKFGLEIFACSFISCTCYLRLEIYVERKTFDLFTNQYLFIEIVLNLL